MGVAFVVTIAIGLIVKTAFTFPGAIFSAPEAVIRKLKNGCRL